MWLSHPAAGIWILAWVGLFPLIANVIAAKSFRQAFARGYLFSWCYFTPLCYWTGLTIVGWTGSSVGWAALFALSILMAFYYGFWAGISWLVTRKLVGVWRILSFASLWTIMEFLRSLGTYTFPWGQIGYSQYKFLPLIQMAEVTGALGVSCLLAIVNASIAEWWVTRKDIRSRRWVIAVATMTGLLCLSGFARILQIKDDQPITVAIMQNNFANKGPEDLSLKIQTYEALMQAAFKTSLTPPQLSIWGETSAPGDAYNDTFPRNEMFRLAELYRTPLFTGSNVVDRETQTDRNSALLFIPGSKMPQRYDKQAIVPFGEFIPFRNLFPPALQKQFQFFNTDLIPGKDSKTLDFVLSDGTQVRLGAMVCYESVYPHYARTMVNLGANLIVAPSNDQWFQTRAAMEQHLSIVVFRAIENRRDIARATTNGISCAIDGTGRVTNRAPFDTPTFQISALHLRSLKTIYARFGDWFVALCLVLVIVAPFSPLWRDKVPKKGKAKRV